MIAHADDAVETGTGRRCVERNSHAYDPIFPGVSSGRQFDGGVLVSGLGN